MICRRIVERKKMEGHYNKQYLEKYEPYPFLINCSPELGERIYGQIYIDEIVFWGNDEGGQITISASLVNEKMIHMEYEAIENGETPLFFYEFTGETTFNCCREYVKQRLLRPFKANEFYSLRMIDIEVYNRNIDTIKKEYKREMEFIGEVIFSASPILSHKVVIIVEGLLEDKDGEIYKKLKATYDNWDSSIKRKCIFDKNEILGELNSLFDHRVVSRNVAIYNVGQANCCYCDLGYKKIFFDIGVTRSIEDINTPLISSAISEVSNLDVDAVVLSHWDLDHILGVCYNKKCMDQKTWIVPDFEKLYTVPRLSIKRLCNYLLKNGKSKLLMVDTTDNDKLLFESCNKAISLYMGEPKSARGINKMNNGGLILKLQNRKNVLLPGDCENSIIPSDAIADAYNYVLISHHGSNMSDPRVYGKKNKKNKAYLSCGNVTGNCKMDSQIVKKYNTNGFPIVHNTKNLKLKNKYKIVL